MVPGLKYISLQSSVGVALVDADGRSIIAASDNDRRRDMIAMASCPNGYTGGDCSLGRLAHEIRSARELSGLSFDLPAALSQVKLQFAGAKTSHGRVSWSNMPFNVEKVITQLQHSGFDVREFFKNGQRDDLVNSATPVPLFEIVRREDGRVIGGGRGESSETALRGALAEGVERIVANRPTIEAFLGSAETLKAERGLFIPKFDVGPRDGYSEKLFTDWVLGRTLNGSPAAIPAERAFYNYVPQSGVSAFSMQHTMGLAAGTTREDAVWAAICEVIERDSYWLAMRCRLTCPTIDDRHLSDAHTEVLRITEEAGIKVILKDFSLDWPIHIVHAFAVDISGRIPAFAHGIASGLDQQSAALRAILECLQIRSGLARRCDLDPEAVLFDTADQPADIFWSAPTSRAELEHLMDGATDDFAIPTAVRYSDPLQIIDALEDKVGDIIWVELGIFEGLHVVRAYLQQALMPDPYVEHVPPRLRAWLNRSGLKYPYGTAILT